MPHSAAHVQTTPVIQFSGAPGSPYTRKMLALLRYRRIPHQIHWGEPQAFLQSRGVAPPKVILHPVFLLPNEEEKLSAVCDSTPIIRRLEGMFAERSVIPDNPAVAFIDYLLEDFADEWCTKYMFHYRWHAEQDADNAGTLLPFAMNLSMPAAQHQQFKQMFSERQISRLYVVGSNEATVAMINDSFRRYLSAMDSLLSKRGYLLGARPGAADFAMFGQLSQLVGFDPTPRAITHEIAPRTVVWTQLLEDLSGLEPKTSDWETTAELASSMKQLLQELGRVYVPALLANAEAVERGDKSWQTTIDGGQWEQQSFPYQAKCLNWIRQEYHQLDDDHRQQVNEILSDTGCDRLFADA